jgi:hypothetical protein
MAQRLLYTKIQQVLLIYIVFLEEEMQQNWIRKRTKRSLGDQGMTGKIILK